jgi:ABC-2 type transport system ATP-binding protein
MSVITVEKLRKYYGDPAAGAGRGVKAVDGVSFEVRPGEIFGFLGPNGAGKTTTIETIEGYRKQDSGSVTVLGRDPRRDRYALRERIGIMLQETTLYPDLRVGELLKLFASYYQDPVDPDALLEMIGLEEKKGAFVRELSGGQRQRVVFILTLINDPELLFLDEPTAGLDPQSRRAIWEWIGLAREKGKTVFLTTHYIDEAERLCDRVAIIDHGKIVALDTPQNLIDSLGAENRVVFEVHGPLDEAVLRAVPGVARIERIGERVVVYGREDGLVAGVVNALEVGGIRFENLRTEQPTLEDVFLALTGKEMRD